MPETLNEDGSPVLIEAVYYRYFNVYVEEFDSVEEAQRFCDSGEDCGSMSSVGVFVDGEPHSVGPWDWKPAGVGSRYGTTPTPLEELRAEYAKAKAGE